MGGLSAILTALVVLVLIMAGYINPKAYAVILLIGLYALAYLVPIGLTYVIICQPLLNLYTNNELVPHVLCVDTVSYTHLRAHETSLHLVCRLLLEKKKKKQLQKQGSQSTLLKYTEITQISELRQ
eukprot:TRINITY_DN22271_c0_g1_i4.p1 TRINITY_DN22271_c0_g1~~TRINITY_DN22271_c0_g1_i4.p1  ORF type:complete len:126 (+),score=10.00 TRINITY_DN22271_c0_g1_i4:296-673(+)